LFGAALAETVGPSDTVIIEVLGRFFAAMVADC
jgi:hypothetical protein